MDRTTYSVVEGYMLSVMEDSAHDKEHVYRVLSNALMIAEAEPSVDYDVLICACLLHDIGRPEQIRDPAVCHAEVGSEKAFRFLTENGFSGAFTARVGECIRTHRFRRNRQPESLEAKILFDADKLDVVGAIGIARTLVYKGTVSEPLYTRQPDGRISNGERDETPSFFREYKYKLENLYDRFYTERGRSLAEHRREAAASFYENLYAEVSRFDEYRTHRLQKIIMP